MDADGTKASNAAPETRRERSPLPITTHRAHRPFTASSRHLTGFRAVWSAALMDRRPERRPRVRRGRKQPLRLCPPCPRRAPGRVEQQWHTDSRHTASSGALMSQRWSPANSHGTSTVLDKLPRNVAVTSMLDGRGVRGASRPGARRGPVARRAPACSCSGRGFAADDYRPDRRFGSAVL